MYHIAKYIHAMQIPILAIKSISRIVQVDVLVWRKHSRWSSLEFSSILYRVRERLGDASALVSLVQKYRLPISARFPLWYLSTKSIPFLALNVWHPKKITCLVASGTSGLTLANVKMFHQYIPHIWTSLFCHHLHKGKFSSNLYILDRSTHSLFVFSGTCKTFWFHSGALVYAWVRSLVSNTHLVPMDCLDQLGYVP